MDKLVKILGGMLLLMTVTLVLVYQRSVRENPEDVIGNWLLVSGDMPQKVIITPKEIQESESWGVQASETLRMRSPDPYSVARKTLFVSDDYSGEHYQYGYNVRGNSLTLSLSDRRGEYQRITTSDRGEFP